MSLVLLGHGGEGHYTHDQEDQEENHGNYEDWHTSPLRPFWDGSDLTAVIAVTGGCEQVPCGGISQPEKKLFWRRNSASWWGSTGGGESPNDLLRMIQNVSQNPGKTYNKSRRDVFPKHC